MKVMPVVIFSCNECNYSGYTMNQNNNFERIRWCFKSNKRIPSNKVTLVQPWCELKPYKEGEFD